MGKVVVAALLILGAVDFLILYSSKEIGRYIDDIYPYGKHDGEEDNEK